LIESFGRHDFHEGVAAFTQRRAPTDPVRRAV
jgi:hypothetical protein